MTIENVCIKKFSSQDKVLDIGDVLAKLHPASNLVDDNNCQYQCNGLDSTCPGYYNVQQYFQENDTGSFPYKRGC